MEKEGNSFHTVAIFYSPVWKQRKTGKAKKKIEQKAEEHSVHRIGGRHWLISISRDDVLMSHDSFRMGGKLLEIDIICVKFD